MPAVSRNRDHGHKLKNHTILFPICQILSGTEAGKFLKSSFPAGKRTRAAGRERRSQRLPLKGKPLRAGLEPAPTMEQGQFLIVTVPCPFCLHPAPDFPSAEEHARDHCGPDQQDRQVAHKEHDQIRYTDWKCTADFLAKSFLAPFSKFSLLSKSNTVDTENI